jgi:hypothetical protein
MTNPDLQETIKALENYLDPNRHFFDMTNVRNAITLLKAQSTKDIRVRAFAARSLGVAENEEYPYSKSELRKALQDAVNVIGAIARDQVAPPQTEDK